LDRLREHGIDGRLTSRSAEVLSGVDPAQTLVVTGDLDDSQVACVLGFDSLLLLGRANGLRNVALCKREARPTYVAPDIRTLEHQPTSSGAHLEPPAELCARGGVVLRRPFRASPRKCSMRLSTQSGVHATETSCAVGSCRHLAAGVGRAAGLLEPLALHATEVTTGR
jgi:hypothetical protein